MDSEKLRNLPDVTQPGVVRQKLCTAVFPRDNPEPLVLLEAEAGSNQPSECC